MVLMAPGGKVPKDRSWKAAKIAMAKVDSFLDSLIHFDKENIHENCLKAIRPYLQDPAFNPELVATKSYAAAGLCSWVINIVRFYEVFCDVEPKRQALNKATSDLAAAQEKLAAIKAKIAVSEPRTPPPPRPPNTVNLKNAQHPMTTAQNLTIQCLRRNQRFMQNFFPFPPGQFLHFFLHYT